MARLTGLRSRIQTRTPQQIVDQLHSHVEANPELYSLEDADALLDELLTVRPDLQEDKP